MDSDDDMRSAMPPVARTGIHIFDHDRDPNSYTLLDVKSTAVPLKFTWSKQAVLPCKLGVRKDVVLASLVRFRAKADIMIPSGRFIYGFSAKDTIFNGRFSVNVPARIVAYQKKVQLPNGANVAVSAGTQFIGGRGTPLSQQFKPIFGVQLRFGSVGDGNIVFAGDGFHCKQRVPVPLGWAGVTYPKLDLETYATIKIPQLTTRYSVQNDGFIGQPQGFGAVQQDDALHVHVQGINAVIRL